MSERLRSGSVSAAAATEQREPQSIATLLRRLTHQLATLFRDELALASAELMRGARILLTGAIVALAGTAVLLTGIFVLLSSAVLGLSHILEAILRRVL
jgi:arginyl-tRNA synthetase